MVHVYIRHCPADAAKATDWAKHPTDFDPETLPRLAITFDAEHDIDLLVVFQQQPEWPKGLEPAVSFTDKQQSRLLRRVLVPKSAPAVYLSLVYRPEAVIIASHGTELSMKDLLNDYASREYQQASYLPLVSTEGLPN